jgi:hypothetical protein
MVRKQSINPAGLFWKNRATAADGRLRPWIASCRFGWRQPERSNLTSALLDYQERQIKP